jgi:hypothetical protein
MTGIKETQEFMSGSIRLGKFVAISAADGLDWKDATALANKLITDEAFRQSLITAVEGVKQIPGELKDLTWDEGVVLAKVAIEELRA